MIGGMGMKNKNVLFAVLGIIVLVVLVIGVFYHFRDRRTYTLNLPQLEKLESISLNQNEKDISINGREEMKRFFCADFYHVVQSVLDRAEEEKNAKLEPDFKVFLTNFYTEALAGMLLEMVQEKDNEKRKQSMEYITKIIQTQISCLVNSLEK